MREYVTIILVLAITVDVNSQSILDSLNAITDDEWTSFKIAFNKVYANPVEENLRRQIYLMNKKKIETFNQESQLGLHTYIVSINSYADMLNDEFNNYANGFNRTARKTPPDSSAFIPPANVVYPDHIDWRDFGAVTPVKQQGMCASCWAFSATDALEGQHFRKTGNLVELSPQHLLDCAKNDGADACGGGHVTAAYDYIKGFGQNVEDAYNYEARENQCRYRADAVGAICTGYKEIKEGDERQLEAAVATIGPISVSIYAGNEFLQFYSDGIYSTPKCPNGLEDPNHSVLLIGYGTQADGQQYWLLKNSFGPEWGDNGFFKMPKGENHCGIANYGIFPLV